MKPGWSDAVVPIGQHANGLQLHYTAAIRSTSIPFSVAWQPAKYIMGGR
jgi:hypothetical protein